MTPLQTVDLTRYVVLFVVPMALLVGLYLVVRFGPLPRRVDRLERRVEELERERDDERDR
ncbi:hypothetical protein [Halolamina sp. C58]|uniref:hypothetical protein n=1 Tax=Halolamina sp. C58 TaxID=3421640 RepID=UPI003EBE2C23